MLSNFNPKKTRDALTTENSDDLISFILDKKDHKTPKHYPQDASEVSKELGWIHPENQELTLNGQLAGDSIREYTLWKKRDRKNPIEDVIRELFGEQLANARILELGCGAGCNLLTLGENTKLCVGLEIEPFYVFMNDIFCQRENLKKTCIVIAEGESPPLQGNTFDLAFTLGSLQYMDIRKSISEISRVLDNGGAFLTIQSSLWQFLLHFTTTKAKSGRIKHFIKSIIVVINTIAYELFGKRLNLLKPYSSTSEPVYPSIGYLKRLAKKQGLNLTRCEKWEKETMLIFKKP